MNNTAYNEISNLFQLVEKANQQDADVAGFKENILSELEKDINWKHLVSRRTVEESQQTENNGEKIVQQNLDSVQLPSPAFEIFGVKITGKITIQIEFADMTAFEEAKAELERINSKNNKDSTKTGYAQKQAGAIKIKFNEEELNKMVQAELVKSDIKIEDIANRMKFEPIEMNDAEIISSKIDDFPQAKGSKFPITISGKIDATVKFADSTLNGQLLRNAGEIWIQGKGDNKNKNIYNDHTTEFDAKKLTGLQVENVAIIPSA